MSIEISPNMNNIFLKNFKTNQIKRANFKTNQMKRAKIRMKINSIEPGGSMGHSG